MTGEVADDAKAVSAAITGPGTPNMVQIDRPSSKAEWTFIGAGVAAVALAVFVISILAFKIDIPDKARFYIGVMGIIAIIGVPLMIVALISPTVGHVSAHAGPGGAGLDIDGKPQ